MIPEDRCRKLFALPIFYSVYKKTWDGALEGVLVGATTFCLTALTPIGEDLALPRTEIEYSCPLSGNLVPYQGDPGPNTENYTHGCCC